MIRHPHFLTGRLELLRRLIERRNYMLVRPVEIPWLPMRYRMS